MAEERPESLDDVRRRIDDIDAEIVRLLNARADCAQAIGRLKEDASKPYFTPEREHEIFDRLRESVQGPLHGKQLVAIFREIISAARSAEKPLTVAYWGPEGTFSHLAAIETFGRSTELRALDSIADVFWAVERGQADYGIAPIENSIAGVVPETLDMFPQTNVRICAETFVAIHHHLAAGAASLSEVERVYAGPQPSMQCKNWLRSNLPLALIVDAAPTAKAAQLAMSDPQGAAIANTLCIELLGMSTLAEHIEDRPGNRTRFVVIGYNEPARSGDDKTSVMFSLRNRPGELYKALGAFMKHDVNLLMIESRPALRASFEYIFYVDCAGHQSDPHLAAAVAEIRSLALETTLLGSYPSTDPNLRIA